LPTHLPPLVIGFWLGARSTLPPKMTLPAALVFVNALKPKGCPKTGISCSPAKLPQISQALPFLTHTASFYDSSVTEACRFFS
jgi:hypothetical protein